MNNHSPKISVILPTYNRPEILAKCLEGFAHQTISINDFEIIIVDDGSTPPVRDTVYRFSNRLNCIYHYQENAGLAAARNACIQYATAPLLALHDDDDIPASDYLARCIKFHQNHPGEAEILLAQVVPHPDLERSPLLEWIFDITNGVIGFPDSAVTHDFWRFYGGTSSCKKSLFRYGLYDPDYRFGFEDMELAFRLNRSVKLRVHYDPLTLSYFIRQPDFTGLFLRSYREGRSHFRFYSTYGDITLNGIGHAALRSAEIVASLEPRLPEILRKIKEHEKYAREIPRELTLEYRGILHYGLDALKACYSACVSYARAKGWADQSVQIAEDSGTTRMHDVLNRYYAEAHAPFYVTKNFISKSPSPLPSPSRGEGCTISTPTVDIVIPPGHHSWNVHEGWVNTIRNNAKLGKTFRPLENNFYALMEYLKNPLADIILLLGFDHHMAFLHNSEQLREKWRSSRIFKILMAQETVIQNCYPDNEKKSSSAISCVDMIVYNTAGDKPFYRYFSTPSFWQPFGVDETVFINRTPFADRLSKPYFRGKTQPIGLPQTYQRRRDLLQLLIKQGLVDYKEFDYRNCVEELVAEFNQYQIALNLPAVFQGFTTRVFESCACGCVLINPRPSHPLELNLFKDGKDIMYYDPDSDQEIIMRIKELLNNPDQSKEIARKGYDIVSRNHTLKNRWQEILGRVEQISSKTEIDGDSFNNHTIEKQIRPLHSLNILQKLPVHFFTIVLNGEPFIRHHIEVFKQLPFQWHWHIIEGVADLKHDTSWSLKLGATITDEMHKNGLSNDWTSEYLDELLRQYPENIRIYRKPDGSFWDGKLEMVNAPLRNINEECLLWEIDADELWTFEQICSGHDMFMQQPEKTAAFYYCHYFVGENLIITTRSSYGNDTRYEWLRTWRYRPGDRWMSHEPPKLCRPADGHYTDLSIINPFTHEETEIRGLVFQHYALVTESQLKFKERYFGYANALNLWQHLQRRTRFPVLLRDYLPWVKDKALVNTTFSQGVAPIAQQVLSGQWQFRSREIQSVQQGRDRYPDRDFANWHSKRYDNYKLDPLLKILPKKILIPRFDTIGDIVLLEGFLEALLNKYPETQIALAVNENYLQLKSLFPERITWFTTNATPYGEPDKNELNTLLNTMAKEQWDLILTTTFNRSYIDDSLSLKLNHVRNIALGEEREITWWLKDIWQDLELTENRLPYEFVPVEEFSHETEKYRKLWESLTGEDNLPAPCLRVSDNLAKEADDLLSRLSLSGKDFCICSPAGTANVSIKAWPEERFADIIAWLENEHNLFTLLTGHETESEKINELAKNAREKGAHPFIWTGKDGELPLLAAITQKARLYFGNDTGSMHIAAALKIPVVGIFGGGTFPRFLPAGPYSLGVAGDLPCFRCYWDCLFGDAPCIKLVSIDDVQKAINIAMINNSLDSNMLQASYKVTDEAFHYIEKAVRKFKALKSDLLNKLSVCEEDRSARLEIIERQHTEFAEKIDECEADRAARLEVINKQAEDFANKEKILEEHMKKQYMTIQELQKEVDNLRRQIILRHGFK